MLAKFRNKRGFTLVELMIVVAIIGVLAALAIYGVKKYLTSAKTAEARAAVGRMAKDGCNKFNGETMSGTVLALDGTAAPSSAICLQGTGPVPSNAAKIQGQKWQSSPADWADTKADAGFPCLRFSMDQPQYFQYNYTTDATTTTRSETGTTFLAVARGDLDGDSTLSTFSMQGSLLGSGTGLICTVSPGIAELAPEE